MYIEIPGVVGDGVVTFAVAVGTKKVKKNTSSQNASALTLTPMTPQPFALSHENKTI